MDEIVSAEEYAEKVKVWLYQAYQANVISSGFPTFLAYQAYLAQQQASTEGQSQQQEQRQNGGVANRLSFFIRNLPNQQQQQQQQPPRWEEYRLPPLWKRFAAEFIDFLFLVILKITITFMAVDWFDLIDLDRYDSTFLAAATGKDLDLETAVQLTSDIVFLEFIHRIVVCLFEAFCTFRGARGRPGGATPGKLIMGLRIFLCDQVATTPDPERIQITPASDLGIFWALLRSVLKNMSLAFFFPICLTLLFLPFNRTAYDVMSRSIVVEVSRPFEALAARQQHLRQN